MLIRSDLTPLPCPGRFAVRGRTEPVGAGEALSAIARGDHVAPADVATAELLADRLRASGNGTRSDMLLRVVGAPVAAAPAAEQPPPEPPAETPDPTDQALEMKGRVDAAGEDVGALRQIAAEEGLKVDPRWGVTRLRDEIFAAVAKRVAEGDAKE